MDGAAIHQARTPKSCKNTEGFYRKEGITRKLLAKERRRLFQTRPPSLRKRRRRSY